MWWWGTLSAFSFIPRVCCGVYQSVNLCKRPQQRERTRLSRVRPVWHSLQFCISVAGSEVSARRAVSWCYHQRQRSSSNVHPKTATEETNIFETGKILHAEYLYKAQGVWGSCRKHPLNYQQPKHGRSRTPARWGQEAANGV